MYNHNKVIKQKLSENAIFYFDVFCSTPGHRADWMGLDEQRILWSQKFEIQDAEVKDWRGGVLMIRKSKGIYWLKDISYIQILLRKSQKI